MSKANGLPKGWEWAKVSAIVQSDAPVVYGILQPGPIIPDGVPYIRPTEIQNDIIQVDLLRRTSKKIAEKYNRSSIREDDVILSIVGTIGKVALVPAEIEGGNITQSSSRIRVNSSIVSPKFVAWALRSPVLRDQFAADRLGTAVPRLNLAHVRDMRLPIPPQNEQRRIVAKIEELFSDLDAGVAALERAKANLKRYRAAVLKAAVEGRLTAEWRAEHPDVEPASELLKRLLTERRHRWEQDQLATYKAKGKEPPKGWQDKYKEPSPPDTKNLPELPPAWCWGTIDSIGDVVGGITKGQKRSPDEVLQEVPYLRVANVQRGFLDLGVMKTIPATESQIESYLLREGDVLFTEGGDRDKLGRGWVWEGQIESCIHQNHIFRVRPFRKEIEPKFVSHHGNTFGREWFIRTGKQSVNLASINMTVLRQFPVPIPPSLEQAEIISKSGELLDQIDRSLSVVEIQLLRSARLRQAILKRAFQGQLVPQDPEL